MTSFEIDRPRFPHLVRRGDTARHRASRPFVHFARFAGVVVETLLLALGQLFNAPSIDPHRCCRDHRWSSLSLTARQLPGHPIRPQIEQIISRSARQCRNQSVQRAMLHCRITSTDGRGTCGRGSPVAYEELRADMEITGSHHFSIPRARVWQLRSIRPPCSSASRGRKTWLKSGRRNTKSA